MIPVLVAGGAGYIGGHTAVALANTGNYHVILFDNLCNSNIESVENIIKLCPPGSCTFTLGDCATDIEKLRKLDFEAVINFAALKSVSESVSESLRYYQQNLNGLMTLLQVSSEKNVKAFVFSSSACVYDIKEEALIETDPTAPSNPYGQTKLMGEQIIKDLISSDKKMRAVSLRYFNPVGCHESGILGEIPSKSHNIIPVIARAVFKSEPFPIAGTDYPTPDGTGMRDYIHIADIVAGHVSALEWLLHQPEGTYDVFNLGTGRATSVLELLRAFEDASGCEIPKYPAPRRPGDLASVVANSDKAKEIIGFSSERTVSEGCRTAYQWLVNFYQNQNP